MSKGGDSGSSASAQTPSQWASALSNASISAWKEADILSFSVAQLQALTPGQISNISVPWAVPMAVWTAETLNAVPLQYWSQWGTRYLSTTSNGVTSITPLSQSSNGAVSGKNNWFDDVGHNTTSNGLAFTPSTVAGISNDRIAQIGAGLGRNQSHAPSFATNAGYVSPSDFTAALSAATASGANVVTWNISASQTAYMFASGWADMGADFMGALTYSQLGAIAHPESALGAAQFGYLSANQLMALGQMDWSKVTSAQLNATKISAFRGLQNNVLRALSTQAWIGLDQAHTAVLNAADVQLLPTTTIARMNYFGYALTASVGAVLTAAQVASIPSTCWAQISDSQFLNSLSTAALQAIPVSAFASMVDAVVGSLDHVHVAALTPNQAQNYPLSKLSDASSAFYQNPSTLNFATFVSQSNVNWALAPASFIKLLTPAQLRLISPSQMAALTPTALSALTRAQTQALSLAQIQALNARQLSVMAYISRRIDVVQQVFGASQLVQLSLNFWSNVDSNFLNALAVSAFQAITTTQLQAIAAGAFANLDQAHVNALTGTQLLALTAEQVGQFSGAYLSIPFLRGVRLAAFKGLVPEQMHRLHDYLFNTVANNAFATTDPTLLQNAENQFASLLASILESDDGREAWLQQSVNLLIQLHWLDPTAAARLSASDVTTTYLALNWSWMSGTFLNSISTAVFAQLQASSVAQLNLNALAELNDIHLQALTATQAAALSGAQLSAIGNLGALSVAVVQSLSATQLAGIHQDWSQISTHFLNNLTASQWMSLPPAQFGQLTAAQLATTAIDWRLISPAQLNALSLSEFRNLCIGANPAILNTTVGVLLGLGGEQMAVLAQAATHYSAVQMNTLLNRLFGAFSNEQTSRLIALMQNDTADQIVLQTGLVALLAKMDGSSTGINTAIQTLVSLRQMQPDWFSAENLSAVLPALSEQYSSYLQAYQAGITTQSLYQYAFSTQAIANLLTARNNTLNVERMQILQVMPNFLVGEGNLDFILAQGTNRVSRIVANSVQDGVDFLVARAKTAFFALFGETGITYDTLSPQLQKKFDIQFEAIAAETTNELNRNYNVNTEDMDFISWPKQTRDALNADFTRIVKDRFNELSFMLQREARQDLINYKLAQANSTILAFANLVVMIGASIGEIGRAIYASDNLPSKERDALIASAALASIADLSQALQLPMALVMEALVRRYSGQQGVIGEDLPYGKLGVSEALARRFGAGFKTYYQEMLSKTVNGKSGVILEEQYAGVVERVLSKATLEFDEVTHQPVIDVVGPVAHATPQAQGRVVVVADIEPRVAPNPAVAHEPQAQFERPLEAVRSSPVLPPPQPINDADGVRPHLLYNDGQGNAIIIVENANQRDYLPGFIQWRRGNPSYVDGAGSDRLLAVSVDGLKQLVQDAAAAGITIKKAVIYNVASDRAVPKSERILDLLDNYEKGRQPTVDDAYFVLDNLQDIVLQVVRTNPDLINDAGALQQKATSIIKDRLGIAPSVDIDLDAQQRPISTQINKAVDLIFRASQQEKIVGVDTMMNDLLLNSILTSDYMGGPRKGLMTFNDVLRANAELTTAILASADTLNMLVVQELSAQDTSNQVRALAEKYLANIVQREVAAQVSAGNFAAVDPIQLPRQINLEFQKAVYQHLELDDFADVHSPAGKSAITQLVSTELMRRITTASQAADLHGPRALSTIEKVNLLLQSVDALPETFKSAVLADPMVRGVLNDFSSAVATDVTARDVTVSRLLANFTAEGSVSKLARSIVNDAVAMFEGAGQPVYADAKQTQLTEAAKLLIDAALQRGFSLLFNKITGEWLDAYLQDAHAAISKGEGIDQLSRHFSDAYSDFVKGELSDMVDGWVRGVSATAAAKAYDNVFDGMSILYGETISADLPDPLTEAWSTHLQQLVKARSPQLIESVVTRWAADNAQNFHFKFETVAYVTNATHAIMTDAPLLAEQIVLTTMQLPTLSQTASTGYRSMLTKTAINKIASNVIKTLQSQDLLQAGRTTPEAVDGGASVPAKPKWNRGALRGPLLKQFFLTELAPTGPRGLTSKLSTTEQIMVSDLLAEVQRIVNSMDNMVEDGGFREKLSTIKTGDGADMPILFDVQEIGTEDLAGAVDAVFISGGASTQAKDAYERMGRAMGLLTRENTEGNARLAGSILQDFKDTLSKIGSVVGEEVQARVFNYKMLALQKRYLTENKGKALTAEQLQNIRAELAAVAPKGVATISEFLNSSIEATNKPLTAKSKPLETMGDLVFDHLEPAAETFDNLVATTVHDVINSMPNQSKSYSATMRLRDGTVVDPSTIQLQFQDPALNSAGNTNNNQGGSSSSSTSSDDMSLSQRFANAVAEYIVSQKILGDHVETEYATATADMLQKMQAGDAEMNSFLEAFIHDNHAGREDIQNLNLDTEQCASAIADAVVKQRPFSSKTAQRERQYLEVPNVELLVERLTEARIDVEDFVGAIRVHYDKMPQNDDVLSEQGSLFGHSAPAPESRGSSPDISREASPNLSLDLSVRTRTTTQGDQDQIDTASNMEAEVATAKVRLNKLQVAVMGVGMLGFALFSSVIGIAAGLAGVLYAMQSTTLSWQAKAMVLAMNGVRVMTSVVMLVASGAQLASNIVKGVQVATDAVKIANAGFAIGNVIGMSTNIAQIGIQAKTLESATDSNSRLIAGLSILDSTLQLILNTVGTIALAFGPVGMAINLVTFIISALLPSTAAIATAVQYRKSYDELTGQGLYKEAEVMYMHWQVAAMDASPIINWTSSIYTEEMKKSQERKMDHAWLDKSAEERLLYSLRANTALKDNFDSLRAQMYAGAAALTQPLTNLSQTLTRATMLMLSQDNLSYFEGDKLATVKLAGTLNYSTNTVSRAPKLLGANVNGQTLSLVFNQDLANLGSQLPSLSSFSVLVNGTAVTVSGLAVLNNVVTLSLATAVKAGQSVTFSYSDPTAGNDSKAVQNVLGVDLSSIVNYSVVNGLDSDKRAPKLADAVAQDNFLTLVFDEALSTAADKVPEKGAFSVLVNGSAVHIYNLGVHDQRVLLSLDDPIAVGATVTVSYNANYGDGALQDAAGNLVASLNAQSVENTGATSSVTASRVGWLQYDNFVASVQGTGTEAASVLNGDDYTVYANADDATSGTSRLRYLSLSNAAGEFDMLSVTRAVENNDRIWLDASNAQGVNNFAINTHDMMVWGGQGKNSYSLARPYAAQSYIVAANAWSASNNVISISGSASDTSATVNLDYFLTADNISAGLPVTQNAFTVLGANDGLDVVVGSGDNQSYMATSNVANINLTGANANVSVGESAQVNVGINGRVQVDMDMWRGLNVEAPTAGAFNGVIKGNYGSYSLLNFAPTDSLNANFNGKLNLSYQIGHLPKLDAFSVYVGSTLVGVNSLSVKGKTVTLNLSSAVAQNEVVSVSYADVSATDDDNTLQGLTGKDVNSFSRQAVVNNTSDTTPPTLAVATVQGNSLIVHFSEALQQSYQPLNSAWAVYVNGTRVAVTRVAFNDSSSLRLTLASAVNAGQMVNLNYSAASDTSLAVQDLAGNITSSFSSASVINLANVAQAPNLRTVTANGNLLTLTFDGTVRYTLSNPSAFVVTANNTPLNISGVSVAGNSVLLSLTSAVSSGQLVEVSYSPPQQLSDATTLRDWLGNTVGSISAQVANNITGQDLTPPSLKYAIVNGTSLVLTFSETLNSQAGFTPLPSGFAVNVNGTAVNVTQAVVSGATVTLSLASAANYGDTLTLSYTDLSAGNDAAVVQDLAGNDAVSFANINVINNTPDTTPPTLLSATVSGNQLSLLFSESLNASSGYLPALSSIAVMVNGVAVSINAGNVKGSTATLTLGTAVNAGDYVTFNYAAPSNASDLQAFQDGAGNDLLSIANFNVTNLTGLDLTPPSLVSAQVNGAILTLTFSEALASTASFTPGTSAFTVSVDGNSATVSGVRLNGTQALLTLASAVDNTAKVTVGYVRPDSQAIQDGAQNMAASFSAQSVSNVTADTTPPSLSSASVAGAIVTLTFSENLATTPTLLASASEFAVTVDGQAVDVLSAVSSGNSVSITLSKAVAAGQSVSVDYTASTSGSNVLQDSANNKTANFSRTVQNLSGLASIQNATVNGATVSLIFNQELDANSTHLPPLSAFAVKVNGVSSAVSNLAVSGHVVTLTLAAPVTAGQKVTVNYTSTDNDTAALQNRGGMDVQSFSAPYAVHNLSVAPEAATPSLSNAKVNGSTLTLTFSEALDAGVGEWWVNYLPDGLYDASGHPLVTSRIKASGFVNVLGSNNNDSFIIGDQSGLETARQLDYVQLGNGQGVQVNYYDTSGNLFLAMGNKGQANVILESGSSLQKLLTAKLVQSDADIAHFKANRDTVTLKSLSSLTAFLSGYETIDATDSTSSLTAEIGEGDHQIKLGGQTVHLQFDKVVSNTSISTRQIPNSWLDYQYFNFNGINADGLWVGRESDGTVLFRAQWKDGTANDVLNVSYDGTLSNVVFEVGQVVLGTNTSQLRLDKLIEAMSAPAFSTDANATRYAMTDTDTSTKLYRITDIVAYSAASQPTVTGAV